MNHYHVPTYGSTSKAGPANGLCRCANHIAFDLKRAGQAPDCQMQCYMCWRADVLRARLAKAG